MKYLILLMLLLLPSCATLQRHFTCHVGPYVFQVEADDVWQAEAIMTGFKIGKGLPSDMEVSCEDWSRASKERVSR